MGLVQRGLCACPGLAWDSGRIGKNFAGAAPSDFRYDHKVLH